MPIKAILHINLFGSLSVVAQNAEPVQIPPSRIGALLALLAIESSNPHPVTREQIVDALWPEDDAKDGLHKLSQTLYDLRGQVSQLGLPADKIFLAKRSSLQLSPELVSVDAAEFEAGLAAAGRTPDAVKRAEILESALELYRGELLPAFYQERFIEEKTRLEDAYHGALNALTSAYEKTGQFDLGIENARKLISFNPLDEEAHFALMRLFAAAGQPSSVQRQYQTLERVLKDDLGQAPSKSAQRNVELLRETAQAHAAERGAKTATAPSHAAEADSPELPLQESPEAADEKVNLVLSLHSRQEPQRSQLSTRRLALIAGPTIVIALLAIFLVSLKRHYAANRIPSILATSVKPTAAVGAHAPIVLARYALAADERGSEPTALATDDTGNLYVAGFVETTHNDADFITIKYNSTGRELWRKRYNGTGNDVDRLRCISVDAGGNVFVTGESDNGKGNGSTRLAGLDVVTIKYSPDGKELREDRYDDIDHGEDRPVKLLLDQLGNAYVLCSCRRLRNGKDAGCDFVLVKYSPELKRLWVRRFDGEALGDNVPTDMALPGNDAGVCVCGYSRAIYKSGQEYDYVTIKYSASGDCLWMKRYGANGNADSYARAVTVDFDGNVYVVGEGRGLPGTPDESMTGCIIVKYIPSGEMLWARGTVREADRLPRVTATAFWKDGYTAIAGPVISGSGATMYRVVLRNADGGDERILDTLVQYHPLGEAPCALIINPADIQAHDQLWMIGSEAVNTGALLDFIVAQFPNRESLRWKRGFSPTSGFNSARAAVMCRLAGPTRIIVAGLCRDSSGKGGITLAQYSELLPN